MGQMGSKWKDIHYDEPVDNVTRAVTQLKGITKGTIMDTNQLRLFIYTRNERLSESCQGPILPINKDCTKGTERDIPYSNQSPIKDLLLGPLNGKPNSPSWILFY